MKVAGVGDSITFGAGIEARDKNCYPAQFAGLLGERYEVKSFGASGATLLKQCHNPCGLRPQFKKTLD